MIIKNNKMLDKKENYFQNRCRYAALQDYCKNLKNKEDENWNNNAFRYSARKNDLNENNKIKINVLKDIAKTFIKIIRHHAVFLKESNYSENQMLFFKENMKNLMYIFNNTSRLIDLNENNEVFIYFKEVKNIMNSCIKNILMTSKF